MNAISVSDSNMDDRILIMQNDQTVFIPRAYLVDMVMILTHIQKEVI